MDLIRTTKKTFHKLTGFFPSKLPTGAQAFDGFCDSVFSTYTLPDLPSYRGAIATMILHLGPTTSYKPKFYFAKSVRKAQANQVAYEKLQELKEQAEISEQTREEAGIPAVAHI